MVRATAPHKGVDQGEEIIGGDRMTIAEKLYISDRDTLKTIIITYQLDDLSRLYFSPAIDTECERLMMPGSYSSKVERRRGARVQRHRQVLK